MIGQSVVLTAYEMDKNGRNRATDLRWTTTDPRIATIDAQGKLSGLANGRVEVRASTADGIAGALSLRVQPDFSGTWRLTQTIVDCTRLSGEGPSSCRFDLLSHQSLNLTFTEEGSRVDANGFLLREETRVILHGDIEEDGVLSMSGTSDFPAENNHSDISGWQSTVADGVQSGSYVFEGHFSTAFGPQVNVYRATFTGTRWQDRSK
jgi:hypothetical protein